MITGLSNYEAVIVGGTITVSLPRGVYSIDGVRLSSDWNGGEYTTHKDAVIERIIMPNEVLSHYEVATEEGTIEVSSEEINKIVRENQGKYWDDDVDEYIYPDRDTQCECLKILDQYRNKKPIYTQPEETTEKVEINIVGTHEDTGSKFIETPIMYGQAKWDNYSTGFYKLNIRGVVMQAWNDMEDKYGKTYAFQNDMSRYYLRYAKINSNYIFSDSAPWSDTTSSRVYTTLESAKEMEAYYYNLTKTKILDYIQPTPLGTTSCKSVIGDLNSILDSVRAIDPKQKTYNSYSRSITKVKELITKLETIISDNHKES